MNVIAIAIIMFLCGHTPAYAERADIQIEPLQIIVKGEVKELVDTHGFKMKSQMFVRQKAKSVAVDDEIFVLRVRVRNYTAENMSVSKDGYLRDEDWVVNIPGFAAGMESDRCKITRISSEDVEPCHGTVRFDDIGPRMARDIDLIMRFTGDIQSGEQDFKVGLKVRRGNGAAEEIVWSRPVSIYVDPWPVREFLKFWTEKEEWRNAQKDMRENRKTGAISRYYLSGGVRVEENYKDGQLDGVRRTYFENGVIREEEHYRENRLSGERFVYQHNKELVLYEIYNAGERVSFARFSTFDQERDKKEKIARVRALVAKEYPQLGTELKLDLVPPPEDIPASAPDDSAPQPPQRPE